MLGACKCAMILLMKQKILLISFLSLVLVFVFYIYSNSKKLSCANSISCISNLSVQVEEEAQGYFLGSVIDVPAINLALDIPRTVVLGEETGKTVSDQEEKRIYIDLSEQKLYTFENEKKIYETLISSGLWGRTPTGEFKIWIKIRSTKMSGGTGKDYYYLPNVPYVMYFYNEKVAKAIGYGIHGAYWHDNFGEEMSHGCINMKPSEAKIVYDWASPTTVKSTTYASKEDPGTNISICKSVVIQYGFKPTCIK